MEDAINASPEFNKTSVEHQTAIDERRKIGMRRALTIPRPRSPVSTIQST